MVVEDSPAMAGIVRLTCPVCGQSVVFREVNSHFEACLQEVLCSQGCGARGILLSWWPCCSGYGFHKNVKELRFLGNVR